MAFSVDRNLYRFINHVDQSGKYAEDPTFVGFQVVVNVNNPSYPLFSENGSSSAIQYLINNGEQERASMLARFKQYFGSMINDYSHYLQYITGARDNYEIRPGVAWKGYDRIIEFGTLESVDMRIASMLELYRKAVYDDVYMRYMVPNNLLEFDMTVLVSEIRKIRSFVNDISNTDQTSQNSKKLKYLNESLTCFAFTYTGCKLLVSGSQPFLGELNNSPEAEATNSFAVSYEDVIETHRLGFIDMIYTTGRNTNQISNRFYTILGVDNDSAANLSGTISSPAEPNEQTYAYDDQINPNTPISNGVAGIDFKKLAGGRLGGAINQSDSVAYANSIIDYSKYTFSRYLQPSNILNDIINLAVDFVDNKIKSLVLGNVFNESTILQSSLNNLILGTSKFSLSGDDNVLVDSIKPVAYLYMDIKLSIYDMIEKTGHLDKLGDIVNDIIAQVGTLSVLLFDDSTEYLDETFVSTNNNMVDYLSTTVLDTYKKLNGDGTMDTIDLVSKVSMALGKIMVTDGTNDMVLSDVISPAYIADLATIAVEALDSYNVLSDTPDDKQLLFDKLLLEVFNNVKLNAYGLKKPSPINPIYDLGTIDTASFLNDPIKHTLGVIGKSSIDE